ncbi:BT_3928 family protein [Carboxylicivirga sp. M1479]|uniref:BT_3928 family protein n=1 Tax=Carboxylicivirga sp. M1479 TaxID=2594476 RepID=UPI0011786242|nr:BT_3928 family protein [Carboxylicivirga sp. M1479]TRX62808.1 DoxX family protein [Carboxylicivirga sp. M1479]
MLKFISRLLPGAVFLFSGFVKAVDPQGSAIKIKEYLEVVGLHEMDGLSIILAIALSSVEFILGFHLLLGVKIKRVALPTLLFMLGFTAITFFIAIFEPVSDCGCFGDAIKLSNWETFFKNIIILPFTFYVYKKKENYQSSLLPIKQHLITTIGFSYIIILSVYSIYYLPVLDFRPYKIGNNILTQMSIPEGADEGEYETTFIMKKDGEQKEFGVNDYPYNDSTWVFVDSKTKVIREGYQPPITALNFESTDGDDITSNIINNERPVFLMIAPKLESASTQQIKELIAIKDMAYKNNHAFYVATSSLSDACFKFDLEHQAAFEYALCDDTTLKTIIRANPGLVVIFQGTIIAKYNTTQLPSAQELADPLSHSVREAQKAQDQTWLILCAVALCGVIGLLYKFK